MSHLGRGGKVGWVLEVPVLIHNAAHDHHGVVSLGGAEGLAPCEQHIQQHSQPPPVHTVVVPMGQHILWSHIPRRTTEGVCAVGILQNLHAHWYCSDSATQISGSKQLSMARAVAEARLNG